MLCCAVLCRRECEKYALACANPDYGNLSFANGEEAEAIETVGAMELFIRRWCCCRSAAADGLSEHAPATKLGQLLGWCWVLVRVVGLQVWRLHVPDSGGALSHVCIMK